MWDTIAESRVTGSYGLVYYLNITLARHYIVRVYILGILCSPIPGFNPLVPSGVDWFPTKIVHLVQLVSGVVNDLISDY